MPTATPYTINDPKQRVIRKKKDPNAPKRSLSAFMFFSNDIRDIIRQERPELAFLEISAEIGRRWQALPVEKRKIYEDMAAKDKQRYMEEKEEYVPDPGFEKFATGRKKKDPNAPKRSLSAYFYYSNEHRDELRQKHPEKKMTEIASLLAQEWRNLTDEQKVKYNKMAEDDKLRYQSEMQSYQQKQH